MRDPGVPFLLISPALPCSHVLSISHAPPFAQLAEVAKKWWELLSKLPSKVPQGQKHQTQELTDQRISKREYLNVLLLVIRVIFPELKAQVCVDTRTRLNTSSHNSSNNSTKINDNTILHTFRLNLL
jgi:hypothetical protein